MVRRSCRGRTHLPALRGQGAEAVQPQAGCLRDREQCALEGIVHGLQGGCWSAAALHQVGQDGGGAHEDDCPVLHQPEHPEPACLRGSCPALRQRGDLRAAARQPGTRRALQLHHRRRLWRRVQSLSRVGGHLSAGAQASSSGRSAHADGGSAVLQGAPHLGHPLRSALRGGRQRRLQRAALLPPEQRSPSQSQCGGGQVGRLSKVRHAQADGGQHVGAHCGDAQGHRLHTLDGRLAAARCVEPDEAGEPGDPQGDGEADGREVPGRAHLPGPGQPRECPRQQLPSTLRQPGGHLHKLALRRTGRPMASLAASECLSHGATWRLLLGAGASRLSHHLAQHELLQQQELVAAAQLH